MKRGSPPSKLNYPFPDNQNSMTHFFKIIQWHWNRYLCQVLAEDWSLHEDDLMTKNRQNKRQLKLLEIPFYCCLVNDSWSIWQQGRSKADRSKTPSGLWSDQRLTYHRAKHDNWRGAGGWVMGVHRCYPLYIWGSLNSWRSYNMCKYYVYKTVLSCWANWKLNISATWVMRG